MADNRDLEQQLAYALMGVGPRAAILTALHQLATAAGLVDQPPLQPSQSSHLSQQQPDSGGDSTPAVSLSTDNSEVPRFVAEAEAAGVVLWDSWMQVSVLHVQATRWYASMLGLASARCTLTPLSICQCPPFSVTVARYI